MNDEFATFIIVGGGVAGALVAAKLGAEGHSVILLEAGSRVDRDDAARAYATSTTRLLSSPYKDPHFDFAPFPDNYGPGVNFKSTYLRRLGGSTWHWQGHTPRMIPADFKMRSLYGVGEDWPIEYDDLEDWYCRAEEELGVAGDHDVWDNVLGARRSKPFPMSAIWPSYADRYLSERIEGLSVDGQSLRVRPTPQARNSRPYDGRPACAGNSSCIPLCPIGAKYDASVHVEKAANVGVQVRDLMQAVRLKMEGNRVVGVVARDGNSPTHEPRTFHGKYVIVCAHAIETVRLLWGSDFPDPSGQLGCNLMDHPTGQMVGLAPTAIWPFRGPPATSGIDDFRDGAFRHERAAWKLSLGNDGWGRFTAPDKIVANWIARYGFGEPLRRAKKIKGTRLHRISWASEQLPSSTNRLVKKGTSNSFDQPELTIEYSVDAYTLNSFSIIRHAILRIFERVGMTHVNTDPNPLNFGGSGHIMGTYRMASSAERGVVDSFGQSYSVENLFLLGSGMFPTVGTSNPTLTIAALALRTADRLKHV